MVWPKTHDLCAGESDPAVQPPLVATSVMPVPDVARALDTGMKQPGSIDERERPGREPVDWDEGREMRRQQNLDFFEAATDAAVRVDSSGVIQRVNREAERLFGYDRSEVIGTHIGTLIPERFRSRHEEERAAYMKEPREREMGSGLILHALRKDGTDVPVSISLLPEQTPGGIVTTALIRDISDGVRAAQELARERDRFRELAQTLAITSGELKQRVTELETVLELVPVGIGLSRDRGCAEIQGNREYNRLLRLTNGADESKTAVLPERLNTYRVLRDGQEIPHEQLPMQVAAATALPVLHQQLELRFEGDDSIWVHAQAAPLFDGEGNVTGSVGAFADITDLRRLQQELRAANAVKDDFVSLVSHELKTPITTILGNALILQKASARLSDADRAGSLDDIASAAKRLGEIVENFLVLARFDHGELPEFEPLTPGALVDSVVKSRRHLHPERAIDVHCPRNLPPFLGSYTYVDQVLTNLVGNAEKYSPPSAPIEIHVTCDGDDVRFAVLDRGTGIAVAEQEAVFTPFYRSPANKDRAGGYGVGLAVCKRLVEVQGGRIWTQPRTGGGTQFIFTLPVARQEQLAG